jgi:hypothetical protein
VSGDVLPEAVGRELAAQDQGALAVPVCVRAQGLVVRSKAGSVQPGQRASGLTRPYQVVLTPIRHAAEWYRGRAV